ncbi:hypothetical protein LXL04_002276 [Taraxacum kok-saghyz]
MYGHAPSLKHLRVYGCLCFSTKLNVHDKFETRAEKCVFIGYDSFKKAYKLLSLENNSVFFSRDVKFYEHIIPYKMSSGLDNSDFSEDQTQYVKYIENGKLEKKFQLLLLLI